MAPGKYSDRVSQGLLRPGLCNAAFGQNSTVLRTSPSPQPLSRWERGFKRGFEMVLRTSPSPQLLSR